MSDLGEIKDKALTTMLSDYDVLVDVLERGTPLDIFIKQPEDKGILLKDILEDDVDGKYSINSYNKKSNKPIVLANIYPKKGQNGNVYSIFGKSKTLSAGVGIKGNGIGSSNAPKIDWDNEQRWRRLTARECELLQNLPYGYCNTVSDTQAYKACGNGWDVGMIKHILTLMLLQKAKSGGKN